MSRKEHRWRAGLATLRKERTAEEESDRQERHRKLLALQREAEAAAAHVAGGQGGRTQRLMVIGTVLARRTVIDDVGTHAGSLTYGALLSIPPLLLLTVSVAGFVMVDNTSAQTAVLDGFQRLLPEPLSHAARDVLSQQLSAAIAGRLSLGLVGAAILLWSASGVASRLRHALGVICSTARTGLLTGRVVGMLIGVLMVAAVFGLALLGGVTAAASSHGGDVLVRVATSLGVMAGEYLFFLALYLVLTPGPGPGVRDHAVGTAVFVLAWEGLTVLGGVYFSSVVAKNAALYGAIGTLFGVIAFLYATAWLLLFGAECSAYRWQRRTPSPDGASRP